MLGRILAARAFWDAYKNCVWIVVPAIGLILALPGLVLFPSQIDSCHRYFGPDSHAKFQHCVAETRAFWYLVKFVIAGPLTAFAYIIVFFTARGEASGRRLTLTFGGLADAYFMFLAFGAVAVTFLILMLALTVAGL